MKTNSLITRQKILDCNRKNKFNQMLITGNTTKINGRGEKEKKNNHLWSI